MIYLRSQPQPTVDCCPNRRDKRAVGVEFISDPVSCPDADKSLSTVRASKLVVVSAGAFGSPTILETSGIGAEAVLNRCGIKQVVNLPGVGEHYRGPLSSIYIFHDLDFEFSDHNFVFVPYYVADEAVTLDPLLRGDESVVRGKHVLAMFLAFFNYPHVENLAQWKIDGKSLIAQKLVQISAW